MYRFNYCQSFRKLVLELISSWCSPKFQLSGVIPLNSVYNHKVYRNV